MKPLLNFNHWMKLCIAILLLLNFIAIVERPTSVASEALSAPLPPETLYSQALTWEYSKNPIYAYVFMFAYQQLNPPQYANDLSRKSDVDTRLEGYRYDTSRLIAVLNTSCNQARSDISNAEVTLPPPSDAVLVCTEPNYQGVCKVLFVGEYIFPQSFNDIVSSVMVGSRVKLILYRHARFDSTSTPPFTSHDPDLSNNRLDSTTTWNNTASAARVVLK